MEREFSLAAEYLAPIRAGRKTSTIRRGRLPVTAGELVLRSELGSERVRICGWDHKLVSELSEDDATADGFDTVHDLINALKHHYPSLTASDDVTVIRFERIQTRHD